MSAPEVELMHCAVCRQPLVSLERCPGCGWLLTGELQLGELTDAVADSFSAKVSSAQQAFDLLAAARAAGYPERGDASLLRRLTPLARGGSGSAADVSSAVGRAGESSAAAEPDEQPVDSDWLVRVDRAGVQAIRFDAHPAEGRLERADTTEWDWPALAPHLSADPVERQFQLAGGVGVQAAEPVSVSAVESWLDGSGIDPRSAAVFVADPAWAVPRRLAETLQRQGARPVSGRGPSQRRTAWLTAAPITAVAVSEDGTGHRQVACGCADGGIVTWSVSDGAAMLTHVPDPDRVTALDLSTDGVLASGSWDGAVRLRSVEVGGSPRIVHAHNGRVNAVVARPGVVLSVGDDARIRRSVTGGAAAPTSPAYPLSDLGSAVQLLAAPSRGDRFAAGGGGQVRLWDGATGESLPSPPVDGVVTALAFDPDGRRLAVGNADGLVALYAVPSMVRLTTLRGHGGPVRSVAITSDRAVTGDDAGFVRRWWLDRGNQESQAELVGAHRGAVRWAAVLVGGAIITGAASEQLIRLWRVEQTGDGG